MASGFIFRVRVEAWLEIIVESSLDSSFKVPWWLETALQILLEFEGDARAAAAAAAAELILAFDGNILNWRPSTLYHRMWAASQSKSAKLICAEPTHVSGAPSIVQMVTCSVFVDNLAFGTATGKLSDITTGLSPLSAIIALVVKDQFEGDTDGTRDTFKYLKRRRKKLYAIIDRYAI
jgi:hypothetical protein